MSGNEAEGTTLLSETLHHFAKALTNCSSAFINFSAGLEKVRTTLFAVILVAFANLSPSSPNGLA